MPNPSCISIRNWGKRSSPSLYFLLQVGYLSNRLDVYNENGSDTYMRICDYIRRSPQTMLSTLAGLPSRDRPSSVACSMLYPTEISVVLMTPVLPSSLKVKSLESSPRLYLCISSRESLTPILTRDPPGGSAISYPSPPLVSYPDWIFEVCFLKICERRVLRDPKPVPDMTPAP